MVLMRNCGKIKLYTNSVTWFLNGIKPVYSPTIFCILLCTLFKELVKMLLVDRQFQNCIKLDWLSNVCMCQSYKYFHQYIYVFVVVTFHLILFDLDKREKNRRELLNNTVEMNELHLRALWMQIMIDLQQQSWKY